MSNKSTKNLIIPAVIIVVAILIGGAIVYGNRIQKCPSETGSSGTVSFESISLQEAGERVVDFINENILKGQATASLIESLEENGLYRVKFSIGEQEIESYLTRDGKLLFPKETAIDLEKISQTSQESGETAITDLPKRDKPDFKLFIMAYCPYGLQAQKAFLPVYNLLKDKADIGIYFVDYAMHGKEELDENLRQYCIQKEQKDKYSDYLKCFITDGSFEKCLSEVNIDQNKLSSCISKTDEEYSISKDYNNKETWLSDQFPKFAIYSDLNDKYGVRGSPSIIINDKLVNVSPRSPEKFKEVLCQAFSSAPAECSQELSSEVPNPGLGWETGSGNSGSCE